MFQGCKSLKVSNLNNFIINNVNQMNNMFDGCSALKELNIYNFDFEKVRKASYMFHGCSSLEILKIKNFNKDYSISFNIFKDCPLNMKIMNSEK